jgi:acetyl esterase/lipase
MRIGQFNELSLELVDMKTLAFALLTVVAIQTHGQMTFTLYDGHIPNSKKSPNEEKSEQVDGITIINKISVPQISVFAAPKDKATGAAVIIFPGGGYWVNAHSHEGTDVARRFNEMGVTAFVVKYRIPDDATMENREIGPLQDAQQAMFIVRSRAGEWNVDPKRVGVMGFSAGGHLASTLGTHYETPLIANRGVSLRPDFMLLIYPVISFVDSVGHMGSREQLIGKNPSREKIVYYSNDQQVNARTPPSFLVHAADDDAVKYTNSVLFYEALLRHNVKAELHLYQAGGHGFGMTNPVSRGDWMEVAGQWMKANGWLSK